MRAFPFIVLVLLLGLAGAAGAAPARIEAGVVAVDRWSNPAFDPMSSGQGERVFDVDVPLRGAWTSPPLVLANLSLVDADQATNLRLQVLVVSVGTTSFKLRFRTWADTRIWSAGATWFAIEAPPGTQPVQFQVQAAGNDRGRARSQVSDADRQRNRLPTLEPPVACPRGSKFGCMPITSGVAPPYGEEHPSVCGCIPECGSLFILASPAPGEARWPGGSAKGTFQCTNTLPPQAAPANR